MGEKSKRFFKILWGAVKVVFIVLLLFIGSLFFREQKIPDWAVERICARLSSDGMLVTCSRASFGFRRGLVLLGVKVYDRDKPNCVEPVASASMVAAGLFPHRLVIAGAKYPRLPESYYLPEYKERSGRIEVELPDVPEFRLVLEHPVILGVEPEKVVARVRMRKNSIRLEDIRLDWPERRPVMEIDGSCNIDFSRQRLTARLRGLALQHHIRPHLVALDIPSALPYFDAFTQVTNPVPARAEFDVNLSNADFSMKLGLRPHLGRYNGVPMASAQGTIYVDNKIRGTNCITRVKIALPQALDREGRLLSGELTVNCSNDFVRLEMDARSALEFGDIIAISDFLDPAIFVFLRCEAAPVITAAGHSGISAEDMAYNEISGSARISKCSVWGMKLRDGELDYMFKGDKLALTGVKAVAKGGGRITGGVKFDLSGFDATNVHFSAKADYVNGELDELSDALGLDLAGRDGKLEIHGELSGLAATNAIPSLNGKGSVKVTEGHLLQMNLFAGLTTLLVQKVPGVEYIVNQSDASADVVIENGVFKTENLYLEGGLISLKGFGSYDAAADNLDLTVRVQFMKKESLMGRLLHPITFPFTKLLLEFKATGSISNPKWDYISILDRVF